MTDLSCMNCAAPLTRKPGSGRAPLRCAPCNKHYHRNPAPRRPCQVCGELLRQGHTGTMHPECKASSARPRTLKPAGPFLKTCSKCGKDYLAEKMSRRYCSQDCLLDDHRAMERIRDAERRRMRKLEQLTPALTWTGDFEANGLVQGPPTAPEYVWLRIDDTDASDYEVRCGRCKCLTLYHGRNIWGCDYCYCKIALLEPPVIPPSVYALVAH